MFFLHKKLIFNEQDHGACIVQFVNKCTSNAHMLFDTPLSHTLNLFFVLCRILFVQSSQIQYLCFTGKDKFEQNIEALSNTDLE